MKRYKKVLLMILLSMALCLGVACGGENIEQSNSDSKENISQEQESSGTEIISTEENYSDLSEEDKQALDYAKTINKKTAEAYGECGDKVKWFYADNTLVIRGKGDMTDYGIYDDRPWDEYVEDVYRVIVEYGVTRVGNYSFRYFVNMTDVVLPDSITSIGRGAFRDNSSLTEISIPQKVTAIEYATFFWCVNLNTVNISDNIILIDDYAFNDCEKLAQFKMPARVEKIGDDAFSGCESLTAIIIPKTTTEIGSSAFSFCKKLSSVTIENTESAVEIATDAFSYTEAKIEYLK